MVLKDETKLALEKLIRETAPVMVVLNWKGLKEENYLYTKEEFLSRVPNATFGTSFSWFTLFLSNNKSVCYKAVSRTDELYQFAQGVYNSFELMETKDNWYWENKTNDLFPSGLEFSNLMENLLEILNSN